MIVPSFVPCAHVDIGNAREEVDSLQQTKVGSWFDMSFHGLPTSSPLIGRAGALPALDLLSSVHSVRLPHLSPPHMV